MCGIICVLLADKSKRVNQLIFDGLTMLQHRGQGKFQVSLTIFQQYSPVIDILILYLY